MNKILIMVIIIFYSLTLLNIIKISNFKQDFEPRYTFDRFEHKNPASERFEGKNEVIRAIVTAYTARSEETDDTPTITASGETVHTGGLACPRKYPFGQKFEILDKVYVCNDRMSLKYPDRFDLYMENYEDAINFGKQYLKIIIL